MKKLAAALLVVVAVIGAGVFWLTGNIDGLIEVNIDIASITKDVIVIRRIAIIAPNVSYENGAKRSFSGG